MADAADHEGRAQRPVAVVVEAPRDLHPFHGCPALLAWRGRAGDQFGSVHELILSLRFTILGNFRVSAKCQIPAMDVRPDSLDRMSKFASGSPFLRQSSTDCRPAQNWFSLSAGAAYERNRKAPA